MTNEASTAFDWWWWWDIAAVLLSVTCLIIVAEVLLLVNGKPLESWSFPIQPNSIISVLTTVSKSAMLVPITSCLSQLKWRHISTQPRSLSHFQVFDDASRGPWGSAVLAWRMPLQSRLGWALALVTVIALGIEPSAQQILNFPLAERELKNVTATIGQADFYESKSMQVTSQNDDFGIQRLNLHAPRLQLSVLEALIGNASEPYVNCPAPATRFKWLEFTSLGVCHVLHNVTHLSTRKCNRRADVDYTNCTYILNLGPEYIPKEPESLSDPERGFPKTKMEYEYCNLSNSSAPNQGVITRLGPGNWNGTLAQYIFLRHSQGNWADGPDGSRVLTYPDILISDLRWCAKTYTNTSTSTRSPRATPMSVRNVMLEKTFANETTWTFSSPKGLTYDIPQIAVRGLNIYLSSMLLIDPNEYPCSGASSRSSIFDSLSVLLTEDLWERLDNVAETLTNHLRADIGGDNRNVTLAEGIAYIRELVIEVRWEWFILPVTETVLTVVLLLVTIVITGKVSLLKTSVMAFLIYPLKGWKEGEMCVTDVSNMYKLDKFAEGMYGKMEMLDGRYNIVKHE
ncbi:hypothetical protein FSARC_4206 [Fusarium sarcochroum]|uniref:Uncharacterized protein n=1 Tax=Fusarium sarcochroum TaxID=1208366 RepID=A0A8H4U2R1_9HYPO|nr:hypothetical protein FSARC_4206 [Fusarium sarcochroum]